MSSPSTGSTPAKKDPNAPQLTPLEKHLLNAGPIRDDGSDKFFGMENVSPKDRNLYWDTTDVSKSFSLETHGMLS